MRVRFQADADLNRHIIAAVKRREPLVDFQTAPEAGLMGLDDPTVLALASSEGRLLVRTIGRPCRITSQRSLRSKQAPDC